MKLTQLIFTKIIKGGTVNILGTKITSRNLYEAYNILWGIVFKKEYSVNLKPNAPLIIDCGSHIGLTVLYFKKIYPKAKIIAIEPNPENFKLLELNIKQNSLQDIRTVHAALSNREGIGNLYINRNNPNWTWDNSVINNKSKTNQAIRVKTVRLSKFIRKNTDLIKLDIEGAEGMVLREAGSELRKVGNIVIEFHPKIAPRTNHIRAIVKLLQRHKFKVNIYQNGKEINENNIDIENTSKPIIKATNLKWKNL